MTELVTPLYAAIAALVFVLLSFRALLLRRRLKVAIGPGDDPLLARAVRVHGNFSEYTPTALLLLFFMEILTGNTAMVHALGVTLLSGRLLHAYGVSQTDENYAFRVAGMALTFTVVISSALAIVARYVPALGSG